MGIGDCGYRSAELTVLSVVEPLLAQAARIRLDVDLPHVEVKPALREFIDATVPPHVRERVRVHIEVTSGGPSEAILLVARTRDAGLIVMGSHGLGGFRKLLFGSTTEQVLRQTERPVLAVPPGGLGAFTAESPGVQVRRDSCGDRFSRERAGRRAVGR